MLRPNKKEYTHECSTNCMQGCDVGEIDAHNQVIDDHTPYIEWLKEEHRKTILFIVKTKNDRIDEIKESCKKQLIINNLILADKCDEMDRMSASHRKELVKELEKFTMDKYERWDILDNDLCDRIKELKNSLEKGE